MKQKKQDDLIIISYGAPSKNTLPDVLRYFPLWNLLLWFISLVCLFFLPIHPKNSIPILFSVGLGLPLVGFILGTIFYYYTFKKNDYKDSLLSLSIRINYIILILGIFFGALVLPVYIKSLPLWP